MTIIPMKPYVLTPNQEMVSQVLMLIDDAAMSSDEIDALDLTIRIVDLVDELNGLNVQPNYLTSELLKKTQAKKKFSRRFKKMVKEANLKYNTV